MADGYISQIKTPDNKVYLLKDSEKTDEKVKQTSNTEDKEFPILFKNANNATEETAGVKYSGNITTDATTTKPFTFNPNTGNLTVTQLKIGTKNDNMGIFPNLNNWNQIGSSALYWYRSYINNYYGGHSHVDNWDSGKNIGTAASSSAAAVLGTVNFYNTAAAGATQTKTLLTADSTTNSNITVTLPKTTGTLALKSELPTLSGLSGIGTISASGTAPLTLSGSKSGTTYTLTGSVSDASASASGVVNTDAQTFSGVKTFDNGLHIYGTISTQGTGSAAGTMYPGGAYHSGHNSIILHGDTAGISGIGFTSEKATKSGTTTNINGSSDRAFIQYHAYGVTPAAEGTAPTLATSGELGTLVIGVGNDATDTIRLQAPGTAGILHQIGATAYPIPHTTNTNGTVGGTTTPVYVEAGIIKAGTALGTASQKAESYFVKAVASTDNAIVRFDGTSGQVQKSGITIDDSDNMTIGSNRILNQTAVPGQGEILLSVFGFKTGYPLYTDPTFVSGMNSIGVYNNSGGGTVTHTRGSYTSFEVPSPGTDSSSIIKIETTGTASPGCGGFVQSIPARANAQFIQIFRALVPADRKLYTASNGMGTGYRDEWLTSNNGTGKWEWYARRVICGQEGTLSVGGHIYIDGSAPVTWYLASCNVYDITKTEYDGLKTRYTDAANLTSTTNAVAYYTDTTGKFGSKASANGALYATSANGALQWGTLPIAQGGTGKTNANDAANTLISGLPAWTANPTDDTYLIRRDTGGTATYGQVKFSTVWNYIKGKADSVYANQTTVNGLLAAADAMIFKGIINATDALPNSHNAGDTYRVGTAGTYPIVDSNGRYCEVGTLIICIADGTAANAAHWTSVETNEDGAVIGPANSTDNAIARFDGATGRIIQNSGITINDDGNLVIAHATSATMTTASINPQIIFSENGTQPVHLIYSDYDSYRSPAGLKIIGGTSASPAWLEVEGNIYAAAFKGNADSATSANYINLYEARGTTTTLNKAANYIGAGKMFHLVASSNTSATDNGKTPTDANILQMNWDNSGGYDAQLGIATGANRMYFRSRPSQKVVWDEVAHAPVGTAGVGNATQPVYMTSEGVITAGTALKALAYKDSLTSSDIPDNAANTTGNAATATSLTNFVVSTYTIAASKGVRIKYPAYAPVLISCQRSTGGSRLILIGGGYGEEGTVRNDFTELVSPSESHFTWSMPQTTGYGCTIEIMHHDTSGTATVWVESTAACTFTEINALTSTKTNRNLLHSANTSAGANNNATLAWNTAYTIAKINGTDIKFTTMTKPTYTASDVGAAPASTVSCTTANVQSILGINTSSGSTSKALTEKGTWVTFGTSNLTIGTTASTAMAGNTTVTNVAISADTTTNKNYALVFGTTPSDGTTPTGEKTEGLQKNIAKLYVNPSTGNIQAETFNGYTLAAASAKSVVTSIDTSASLPTSNAVKAFVEGKGYVTSSDITTAINALDGTITGSGSATKTITALSQTNGKVSATFSDIAFPVTSVAGLSGAITASNLTETLGLSKALRFVGITTTDMTGTTATNHTYTGKPAGISDYTPAVGDVVINNTKQDEWVCIAVSGTTYTWERLGSDTSYKIVQSAVSDPTAASTTSTTFIDTISQNANGVISATKKTLPTASTSVAGIIKIGTASTNAMAGNTTVTNVSYTAATDDNDYPILMKNSTGSTTTAAGVKFASGTNQQVTINPSTGTVSTRRLVINNSSSNGSVPDLVFSRTSWSYINIPDNDSAVLAIGRGTGDNASQKLIIQGDGTVRPGSDNTQVLGKSTRRWKEVHGVNFYGTFNGTATYSQGLAKWAIANSNLNDFVSNGALRYSWEGGNNGIDSKPTDVNAFGVIAMKTATNWTGQLLMSTDSEPGLYWRTNLTTDTPTYGSWTPLASGNGGVYYGTCATAADVAAKVVVCKHYHTLKAGDIIVVTFTNSNTQAQPTLNVNNTGAVSVKMAYSGGIVDLGSTSQLRFTCTFIYDGTYWLIINQQNAIQLATSDGNLNWRSVLLSDSNSINENFTPTANTLGRTYAAHNVKYQPSTGTLRAPIMKTPKVQIEYDHVNKAHIEWNDTDSSIDFIFD